MGRLAARPSVRGGCETRRVISGDAMTIEEHFAAVRKDKVQGMAALIAAIRTDKVFAQDVSGRLANYKEMERADRLKACWISTQIKETLTAALAAIKTQPGVPAGG